MHQDEKHVEDGVALSDCRVKSQTRSSLGGKGLLEELLQIVNLIGISRVSKATVTVSIYACPGDIHSIEHTGKT